MDFFSKLTVYNDLLTPEECQQFLTKFHESKTEKMCNRQRLKFDDKELAANLWKRIHKNYPYAKLTDQFGDKWKVSHLNQRFRLTHYEPGQEFGPHFDGTYEAQYDVQSFATLTVYLNHDFEGGFTHFIDYGIHVAPKRGRAFLFVVDSVLHEGQKVSEGYKYILRTDVMYKCTKMRKPDLRRQIFELKQANEDLELINDLENKI